MYMLIFIRANMVYVFTDWDQSATFYHCYVIHVHAQEPFILTENSFQTNGGVYNRIINGKLGEKWVLDYVRPFLKVV